MCCSAEMNDIIRIVLFILQVTVIKTKPFCNCTCFKAPVAVIKVVVCDFVRIIPGTFLTALIPATQIL